MYGKTNGGWVLNLLGKLTGTVTDAADGTVISGVSVVFGSNSASTGSNGVYLMEVNPATGTVTFSKSGYISNSYSVTVTKRRTTTRNAVLTKQVPIGTYRAVLEWGEKPRDLDSHILGPNSIHVYYGNKTDTNTELDLDDTTSYGPETITFTPLTGQTFHYYVHNWSKELDLAGCGATVTVYKGSSQLRKFTIPSSGTGEYWDVFRLVNGTLYPVNSIVASAPTSL